MPDQQLVCRDCQEAFTFTEGEQEFYASKTLSPPSRCKPCRERRKEEWQAEQSTFDITCASCGAQTTVPFAPRPDEPVLCETCFRASRDSAS